MWLLTLQSTLPNILETFQMARLFFIFSKNKSMRCLMKEWYENITLYVKAFLLKICDP